MSAWWVVYLIPLLTVWSWQVARRRRIAVKGRVAHVQAQRAGLNEPVSLHPTINASLCVGCSECVKACPEKESDVLGMVDGKVDVVIVGAGPAGFAASLTAMSLGLKYVTVEQESLGGCVFQYPRAKLVMTSPVEVPIIGKLKITQTSKEELLEFWQNVERKTGVAIKYRERVESITARGGGFLVRTAKGQYAAASVLLA